jgi:hypothetical protein
MVDYRAAQIELALEFGRRTAASMSAVTANLLR